MSDNIKTWPLSVYVRYCNGDGESFAPIELYDKTYILFAHDALNSDSGCHKYILADIVEEEKEELKQTISDMYDLCISDMHDLCMRHIKATDDARIRHKEREAKLITLLQSALIDMEAWAEYAGEYIKDKHLPRELAFYRAGLEALN